jgi:serine/threonine-protein kinase
MSSPVNVGDILAGKYQVERVLGVGGMGVVVSAKHLTLGERVAIKFLLPQALARTDVVKRFLQEGQAAARLRSEHVARVHDVGKLEAGAPFLVMEYLDGFDIGQVLRDQGPLSVESAVDYVLQACEALAEAHAIGIIHRDLKPSNLFLIKRLDGTPSIKLIDFGISKVTLPGAEGAEGEMTATAVMMGSPLYMAPEQMASARDVDGRADIWSLGIILHTMLTCAPPFRAPTVMGVYELIVQGAPPIRGIRADVPAGLEAVILKCLIKDRRQRYGNVGELADALADFGPPNSRLTSERIKRIIVAHTGAGSIPPPPTMPVAVVAITSGTPVPASVARAPTEPASSSAVPPVPTHGAASITGTGSGVSQSTGSSSAIDPHGTDGPWDQRTRPPASRRRPLVLIAASVVALAVGGPAAFFLLRSQLAPHPAPATDPSAARTAVSVSVSSSTAPPASGSADAPPPAVLPGDPAGRADAAAPPPTADPAASVRPRRPPIGGPLPQPGGPAPPPTAKPGKPRTADDLFGTQK